MPKQDIVKNNLSSINLGNISKELAIAKTEEIVQRIMPIIKQDLSTLKNKISEIKNKKNIDDLLNNHLLPVLDNKNISLLERNIFIKKVIDIIIGLIGSQIEERGKYRMTFYQYREILDDEDLFMKSFKNAKDIYELEKVLKGTNVLDPARLRYNLLIALSKIKYDTDLIIKLRKLILEDRNIEAQYMYELPLLLKLMNIIKSKANRPQEAIQEIKTNYPKEIEPVLKKLEEKETTKEKKREEKTLKDIKESTQNIAGEEIKYLRLYIKDLERWPQYFSRKEHISFFINRVNYYVYGGAHFKGILRDFGDEELVKRMKDNFTVKGLMRFIDKYNLIQQSYNTIRAAYNKPEWEGFLGRGGWIKELGKKYAPEIEKEFGDKELADYLRETKKKLHEDIKDWTLILHKIQKNLIDSKYQQRFIERAANSLTNILSNRIKELTVIEEKELAKLEKHLEKRMKEIEKESKSIIKKLYVIVTNKKEDVLTERTVRVLNFIAALNKSKLIKNQKEFTRTFATVLADYNNKNLNLYGKWISDRKVRGMARDAIKKIIERYGKHEVHPYFLTTYWNAFTQALVKEEINYSKALLMYTDDPTECIQLIIDGLYSIMSLNHILEGVKNEMGDFELTSIKEPSSTKDILEEKKGKYLKGVKNG